MKEILLLSGIYPPDIGGPAKFVIDFSEFLNKKNQRVQILTYTDGSSKTFNNGNSHVTQISRRLWLPIRYFVYIMRLTSKLRKRQILANGCFVELSLLRLFLPIKYSVKIPGDIVWERARNKEYTKLDISEFQKSKLNLKYRLFRKLFSFSLIKAKTVIVPSKLLYELCLLWGVKPDNIVIVNNSIDVSRFQYMANFQKKYDVCSIARLVPWKGFEELIRAASNLKLSLLIVGDGPQKENLKKLVMKLNADVTFLDNLTQEELPFIYNSSRFFVLNSTFEATSYALLEAMSSGCIVISNEDTGSAEVITNLKDGLLCGPKSKYTLETALYAVKTESVDLDFLRNNAIQKVNNSFNQDRNFNEILKLVINDTNTP